MTTTQIQERRDTAANWTSQNPTLASGEPGFETDTQKFKIGDGATAWSSLPYFVREPSGVLLARSTNQSINDSTLTDVTWPTETYDANGWHAANAAEVVIPRAAWGMVTYRLQWAANATGGRGGQILVNGTTAYGWTYLAGANLVVSVQGSSPIKFAASDSVKVQAYQDSGGALNVTQGNFAVVLFG